MMCNAISAQSHGWRIFNGAVYRKAKPPSLSGYESMCGKWKVKESRGCSEGAEESRISYLNE